MAEITAPATSKKKTSFSGFRKKLSTRVDLTPMVDLGFLLLTFFVFTSTMAEAKVMDLIEPHDGEASPVKSSAAMTIILGKDHQLYYYYGKLTDSTEMNKTNFRGIRQLIVDKKKNTDTAYLIYIIKAGEGATFGDSMNLLDEMLVCDIKSGHYAEVDMSKEETERILAVKK